MSSGLKGVSDSLIRPGDHSFLAPATLFWVSAWLRYDSFKICHDTVIYFSFGGYYAYNETAHSFDFAFGETFRIQDDTGDERIRYYDESRVNYPPIVNIIEGNHPEVFSANGSHGSWASEGKGFIMCCLR